MNMGLVAADLSLGSSAMKESTVIVKRRPDKHHLDVYPVSAPCDLRTLEVYHKALEDERLKIQAFERELPFCMQLLENAIEASKEQLEERLACKLNTPLHEPQLAATTHEFVCNYTSSFAHTSLLPAVGEINLRFKRKWSNSAPSTSHSNIQDQYPHPYSPTASGCTRKRLLPQNTKLSHHEDLPITCIKGSIKFQEFSIPEHGAVLPAATDHEPHKLILPETGCHTKSIAFSCSNNTTPSHALALHNAKQSVPSLAHSQFQEDRYRLHKMQEVDDPDAHPAPRSLNEVACLDATCGSSSFFSRPLANLSPKELQLNSALSTPSSKICSPAGDIMAVQQPGGQQRKPRRCWSSELHQRFLSALNHLGGCQVATPKQIRELMNVEGLTNDEVKSHLQKFRLHMRRPNALLGNSQCGFEDGAAPAGRHLVVFGHIWVPPEYEDQPHRYRQTTNRANIDEISSDCHISAANSTMELMQSLQSSSKKLITSSEHVQDGRSGQLNYVKGVQCQGGTAHTEQLSRLCQERKYTMSNDQAPLHCESRYGLGCSIHHHNINEGCNMQDQRVNAANTVESERETTPCRHQLQQGVGSLDCEGADGFRNRMGGTVLITAKKDTPLAQLTQIDDDRHADVLGAAGDHS